MEQIWNFTYMVLLAVGMFLTGVYQKQLASFYKRLFTRKKRTNTLASRVEQLEKRVELHTRKDGVYLDKFDELEKQIAEVKAYAKKRESDRTAKTKKIVINYLNELKK